MCGFLVIFTNFWGCHCSSGLRVQRAYAEPCETSKMGHFAKIVNDLLLLTIFAKRSILDVSHGSAHASRVRVMLQLANTYEYVF